MSFRRPTSSRRPRSWPGQLRPSAGGPALWHAVANTAYFALLALIIGFPVPLVLAVIMEPRRATSRASIAHSPTARGRSARRGVLLWKVFYKGGTNGAFNSILGTVGIDRSNGLGTPQRRCIGRGRGNLGCLRRNRDHLLAALLSVPRSSTTRPSRWGLDLAEDPVRDSAAPARDSPHHADPSADCHGPDLHGALPAHRGRPGQRDDDGSASEFYSTASVVASVATSERQPR